MENMRERQHFIDKEEMIWKQGWDSKKLGNSNVVLVTTERGCSV